MRRQQTKSRKRHEPKPLGDRCADKGKVIFPSFERADKAARQMTWKLRETTREVAKPYVCPFCDQWHIGRGPRGSDGTLVQTDAAGQP
jgi:hypothetical protein